MIDRELIILFIGSLLAGLAYELAKFWEWKNK
jgi:hypothetical protein